MSLPGSTEGTREGTRIGPAVLARRPALRPSGAAAVAQRAVADRPPAPSPAPLRERAVRIQETSGDVQGLADHVQRLIAEGNQILDRSMEISLELAWIGIQTEDAHLLQHGMYFRDPAMGGTGMGVKERTQFFTQLALLYGSHLPAAMVRNTEAFAWIRLVDFKTPQFVAALYNVIQLRSDHPLMITADDLTGPIGRYISHALTSHQPFHFNTLRDVVSQTGHPVASLDWGAALDLPEPAFWPLIDQIGPDTSPEETRRIIADLERVWGREGNQQVRRALWDFFGDVYRRTGKEGREAGTSLEHRRDLIDKLNALRAEAMAASFQDQGGASSAGPRLSELLRDADPSAAAHLLQELVTRLERDREGNQAALDGIYGFHRTVWETTGQDGRKNAGDMQVRQELIATIASLESAQLI